MNQSIVACKRTVDIGVPVVLWDTEGGLACPHRRGREACTRHNSQLNLNPPEPGITYDITDPDRAYEELKDTVYQLILHYDVCYCSRHCHQTLTNSSYLGSHFYLDVDGTLYQTCDLYWKTNTAPADDRKGNERAVHVEMSNLSWEALLSETSWDNVTRDQYRLRNGRWELALPDRWKNTLQTPGFRPFAARGHGERGYFSRRINGKIVRMWDYTEEQYQTLIRLCIGLNRLLPKIRLRVPYDKNKKRTPLDRIRNYSAFAGVMGHFHVQKGGVEGVSCKFDPGSAFNWPRLRRAFEKEIANPQPFPS
ncbi:N-acetylmuramyl-L-alanine amidase [Candidatus Nitromaritima sp. SCGC AAA799-A02]|nr:N-acetylmuramyl-L-alanine amidase [Candidatus Nitromaritima sp. SCGC AAA799-C22]KMP11991.1 N-acetylmuramyl-L-alanine amidase [Candidatus Nitromaritima sp. SCGC AAA799-A02]